MRRLAKLIANYRLLERQTCRELAAEIGISASTLSRIEHGEKMDAATLWAVLAWIVDTGEEKEA